MIGSATASQCRAHMRINASRMSLTATYNHNMRSLCMANDTALPYREQCDKDMRLAISKELDKLKGKGKSGKGSGSKDSRGKGKGSKADKGRSSSSAHGVIRPVRAEAPLVNLQERQEVDMRALEVRSRNPSVCTLQFRQLELLRDSLRRAKDALDAAHRGLIEMAHRVQAESKVTSVAHEVLQAILQEQLPE